MVWVGRDHEAHLSWAGIPSSRPGCSEPCTTSECKSYLNELTLSPLSAEHTQRFHKTCTKIQSLYFHSSGSRFGTHSHKPLALPHKESKHPYRTHPNGSLVRHKPHCSCLPLCMVTSRKVHGCARQQQGLKCWGGEKFKVDVAVACSWTSPMCNGTLAHPHQW